MPSLTAARRVAWPAVARLGVASGVAWLGTARRETDNRSTALLLAARSGLGSQISFIRRPCS
jgi:hypothetical protein